MKNKKNLLSNLLLFIYIFYMIYQPNFSYIIKVNNYFIFTFMTVVFFAITICKNKNILKEYGTKKNIFLFIVLTVISTLYFALRVLINIENGVDISFNDLRIAQGLYPILYLIGAIMINESLNDRKMNTDQKIRYIFKVILLQSAIAGAMVLFPNIKQIAIEIFRNTNGFSNVYIERSRLYGICDGDYTFGLQIIHSIFAFLALCFAYKNNEKKYYLYSLAFLMVTLLNGRSGLLIFAINFIIFLLSLLFKRKESARTLIFVFTGIILLFISYVVIKELLPNTYTIIVHAIKDVFDTLNGSDGTETRRFIEMFMIPTGLYLVFGMGFRIIGNKGNKFGFSSSSDIGFVNDLFMGGFIYSLLLYASYYQLIKPMKKNESEYIKMFLPYFVLSLILANLKGEIFRQSIFISSIILFGIIFGCYKSRSDAK